jgi:hypothetical protein
MGWYECNPSEENMKLKEQVHQNDLKMSQKGT